MTRRQFWLGAAAVSGFSLWLRAGFPVQALGENAYDDMLFIKHAGYLGAGQWLGPYSELTLAKGMFYPLFILLAFAAAIPLKIAEQLAYLAASALTARFAAQHISHGHTRNGHTGNEAASLALFAALALNPVLWSPSLARVIREGLYLSLSLAVVALTLCVVFPPPDRQRRWPAAIALGLVAAAFWLTREEGFWLLPAVAVPPAILMLQLFRPRAIAARLRPLLVSLAGFAAALALVAGINAARYGVFRLTDFQSGSFIVAYGAISRIQPDAWRRYVVFPEDARRRAYAVSPAASELQPYLDGEPGRNWREAGCNETGSAECPEILSGWFLWALRGAAAQAGHHRSAREADAFYERLAGEINHACDTGSLACLPRRATMLPPMRRSYLTDALVPAGIIAGRLLRLGDGRIGVAPSQGEASLLRLFAGMTGAIAPRSSGPATTIRGWAGSGRAAPQVYIAGSGDAGSLSRVELPTPHPMADPQAVAFVITTDCPAERCALVATDGTDEIRLRLNALPGTEQAAGPLHIRLESPANAPLRDIAADPALLRQGIQLRIAAWIARLYWYAMPVLSAFGAIGLGACLWLGRRHPPCWPMVALTAASLTAVLCRIALLAFMDVSSIPGTSLLYASPASAFVIVFAITGCWLGMEAARGGMARSRQRNR